MIRLDFLDEQNAFAKAQKIVRWAKGLCSQSEFFFNEKKAFLLAIFLGAEKKAPTQAWPFHLHQNAQKTHQSPEGPQKSKRSAQKREAANTIIITYIKTVSAI